jgi:hypothetical protein
METVREMAVRKHALDPEIAALHARLGPPPGSQPLHLNGWAYPPTWLWGHPRDGPQHRYLCIPKAGSTSIRTALADEFGFRSSDGEEWHMGGGHYTEDGSRGTLTATQRSLFGWTFVDDPVEHFIGGWAQAGDLRRYFNGSVHLYMELLRSNSSEALKAKTEDNFNVHIAPQLRIIRAAAEQFGHLQVNRTTAPAVDDMALSFVGHIHDAVSDWASMRDAMTSAGVRAFNRSLPHARPHNDDKRGRLMGVYSSPATFPAEDLRTLCMHLLDDFVCLGYAFPPACRVDYSRPVVVAEPSEAQLSSIQHTDLDLLAPSRAYWGADSPAVAALEAAHTNGWPHGELRDVQTVGLEGAGHHRDSQWLLSASAAPLSEYSKLMTRWRRPGSRFAECLQKEAAGSSGSYVLRRGQFLTAGVEGAGHHMFEAMPPSLCPANISIQLQRRCGLQQSLPYGVTWRRSRTAVPKLAVCSQFLPPKTEKSLLLVRDPVDAFTSALSRFWRAKKVRATGSAVNDTLRGELAAEYEGWLRLEACASQMPCESAVLVSYELLLLFPSSIVPRLADFLGVDADDADLARWVAGLRSPGSDASRAVRASWAGELSGVDDGAALRALRRPLPYSCNSTAATNIATKLRDEIGRWDAKRPETWALIEPWMTALPSMHSDRAPGRHPAETFPWPHLKPGAQDELEWPAWAKTCMASGETHQCYDAFRAEVRRWFYEDHPLSVFPLVPMSAEPCA